MMATGTTASHSAKASVSDNPIRWLILGGVLLIAGIAIGTTIMVGNFRQRALDNSKRELKTPCCCSRATSISSSKTSALFKET
jgi:hypothetical protein